MAESGGGASILLICDFNAHGGTQTHVLHLMEGLRARHFRPSLAALTLHPDLARRLSRLDAPVIDLSLRGVARLRTWTAVARLVRQAGRQRPDLLHGFLHQGNALTALVSRLTGIPCLTSVRNVDLWKRARHRSVSRWSHRRARRVVFNAEAVRELTIAQEWIPRDRTCVVLNGVADPMNGIGEARSGRGRDEGPVVICVASLRPKKGHRDLLDAFAILRGRFARATLRLVGEGPLRRELEQAVEERGLQTAVRFEGYRADAVALMREADLFVLPSLEEGMPNALLEAMGLGLAAVATAVGGTPEAIQDGVTGLLVPARDAAALAGAMATALEEPQRRGAMGRAARARFLERFTLPRMIAAYESLYRQVLEEGR